jgi:protein O-mannosyl-transferase
MAKKNQPKRSTTATVAASIRIPDLSSKHWFFTDNFVIQSVIIALICGIFYGNSYKNEYALDDDIIMKENMYVQKGFAGIGDIMTNDAYKSYYENMGVGQQLSGGRYRPLSVVTFAIEQQLFGECYGARFTEVRDSLFELQRLQINDANFFRLQSEKTYLTTQIKQTNMSIAHLRHAFQVVWFAVAMIVLLWFLRECIFRFNTDLAFFAAVIFAIHPIHTEVIANVKSRDEIFSLMFICLTFIYYFRYDLSKKRSDLIWASVHFLLAVLAKEYALTLAVLIPAGLWIVRKRTLKELVTPIVSIGGILVLYAMFRFSAIGVASAPVDPSRQDPLNDPYMFAKEKKITSIIDRLDDYLQLLVYPHPLVSDYSYKHFEYTGIADISVWISLLIHLFLVGLTVKLVFQRHLMGFVLLLYFAFFMLINNVLFDVGATMGERLIYHSSMAFCIAVAWLLDKTVERFKAPGNMIFPVVTVLLAIPAFMLVAPRNLEWKNDYTLFTSDVKKHPNSALTNGNAGARYMDKGMEIANDTTLGLDSLQKRKVVVAYADTAIVYLAHSVDLHRKYVNGYLNLGLCHYYKEQYEQAAEAWNNAYKYFPSNQILLNYQQMLIARANGYAAIQDYANASRFMRYAAMTNGDDPKVWGDYAGSSFMARNFTEAKTGFYSALSIIQGRIKVLEKSTNAQDQEMLMRYRQQEQNLQQGYGAADHNEKAQIKFLHDSTRVDSILPLAQSYTGTVNFYPESRRLLIKVLTIDPSNQRATFLLDSLGMLEKKAIVPPPPVKPK